MSAPKAYVDGQLIIWGERLFHSPLRKARIVDDPARNGKKILPNNAKRASYVRGAIERTLRRSPEVMVKITSKQEAGRGMARIRPHLEYISRNGKLALEDQDGNKISGWAELKDLEHEWKHAGLGIPETSSRREAINVIFSMASGTDAQILKEAVKSVAQSEFSGHRYVMAVHDDTDHTHVHLCLQAKNQTGKYLNPRKADLGRWRESFAQQLRNRGIDANATPRKTRGITKQYVRQEVLHQKRRYPSRFPDRQRPVDNLVATHKPQLHAWAQCIQSLGESEVHEDRMLAQRIDQFTAEMPVVREIGQQRGQGKVMQRSKTTPPPKNPQTQKRKHR